MTSAARLSAIRIVLVSPLHPGNVGAAARALKNMALGGILLTEMRRGRDLETFATEARRLAVEASDVLDTMVVAADLTEALPPSTFLVATTARPRKHRPPVDLRAAAPEIIDRAGRQPVAVLFGREDHGLPRRLVDRADLAISIPTSRAYPSLNLAQAVAVVAYELRQAALEHDRTAVAVISEAEPAQPAALDDLHREADLALHAIDFWKPHTEQRIRGELSALLARVGPSQREVEMLLGICRQLQWLARKSAD